jgi:multidrug efflux pump subunit AcrA (membrane-fusion protein)
MVIDNPDLDLRPEMFATVEFESEIEPRAVLVPRAAVIDTGLRQVVFVAQPQGHFLPRRVRMGAAGDDGMVQILEGVAPGEQVVISGQFLLDAESRFQEGIQKYLREGLLEPGTGTAAPPLAASGGEASHDRHAH